MLLSFLLFFGVLGRTFAEPQDRRCSATLSELPSNFSFETDAGYFHRLLIRSGKEIKSIEMRSMKLPERVCRLVNGSILLMGTDSSVTTLAVVNPMLAKVVRVFWAYEPALSPNRRYIVFRQFYPIQTPVEQVSDEYFLFDVTAAVEPVADPFDYQNPPGQRILPLKADADESTRLSAASKGIFWSDDSRFALFAVQDQNRNKFVLLDLSSPGQNVLRSKSWSPQDVCTAKPDKYLLQPVVKSATFAEVAGYEHSITIEFEDYGQAGCRPGKLRLMTSEFTQ